MNILTNDLKQILISVGVVLVCVALFISTYLLNKNTKKPEGCETLDCEGCSLTDCSHHPNKNKEKGEE